MKSERFKRTKSVMASGAIALVVAALAFGVSSSVLGPRVSAGRHLGFDLTSGTSSFTITSNIYPSPACSGSPALLYPATSRCMVFSVHNNLKAAISVQTITAALDTTDFPAPPADCAGANLVLPTFSGSFNVAGGGDATSAGVPIELKDDGAPQADCENLSYHFAYTGSANYTEVYSTATGVASSQNPSTAGQTVTYTATVTASATASQDPVPSSPTGTVTFKDGSTTICNTVAVISTGSTTASAQCTVNYPTTAGSPHPITASYANADGNFSGSNGTLSQVVNPTTTSTSSSLSSSLNPATQGTPVTFTDMVSSSSGTPTGSVTFYTCTSAACSTKSSFATGTLNSGKATLSTSSLPVGTTFVEAIYPGSGSYLTSTSNVVSQVINPTTIATSSSLTASPNPSSLGSSVAFTDTVSSGSGTPGGTVTFYSCTTSACSTKNPLGASVTLSGGKASFSTASLPVGTSLVEAIYAGSGNYVTSTSNLVSQVVNALATTSSLTSSPNPSTFGSPVTFTDKVSSGSGTPTGSVTFYGCTTAACSTKSPFGTGTLSLGKASLSTSALSVGTNFVEAVYAASGNYVGSTSNVVTQVVNALATTSSLTSSPNPSSVGSPTGFTDAVSANSGTPGGAVTFYRCATSACSTKTPLGASVTLSGGRATLSTSALPAGTSFVEAVYAASGNYAGSTSNVVSQVVIAVPSACPSSGYSDYISGSSPPQFLFGTNGNDFISAFGGIFWIEGFSGNDCITVGDGSDDIYDGNGTNGVLGGNGSDDVFLGDGNNKVSLGNGTDWVQVGNGNDAVTVGNGWLSNVIVGNGNDSVSIGSGSYNGVYLGNGTDTVTIQSQGSHDTINGGGGNEVISLGSGTYNTYYGQPHHTNVCHLPAPPASYHGPTAAYYHDTLTNCTVVTP